MYHEEIIILSYRLIMDKKTPQEGPNSPIVSSRRAKRRKIAKKASIDKNNY